MRWITFFSLISIIFISTGCTGIPGGIEPVQGLDITRYTGTWYEIARLDHSFERGLINVSATYTQRDDGGIDVLNRGYSPEDENWKEAAGRAYFVDSPGKGHLKVSFFRPFYASYVIFELDKDYNYAFVTGNSRSYLWLLSRTPQVRDAVKKRFEDRAGELGFNTQELIYVRQETP